MVSFDTLPVELQTEMQKLGRGIDRAMVRIDVGAIFDYCRTEPVDAGATGAIGFCLGGRIAFLAGQEFPGRIRAVASLHGTLLVTDAEDSPHRRAYLMRGEVYCGHAEHDRFSEPSILAALAAPLEDRADLTYRQRFHAGAHHGYSMPDRDVHDATATAADWREIYAMLGRQLQAAR